MDSLRAANKMLYPRRRYFKRNLLFNIPYKFKGQGPKSRSQAKNWSRLEWLLVSHEASIVHPYLTASYVEWEEW